MKFIRPYGQSITDNSERKIVLNDTYKKNAIDNNLQAIEVQDTQAKKELKRLQSINDHFKNQTKVYLSAVISTLDKIILKPAQGKECPNNIHQARLRIANALWSKLEDNKLYSIKPETWNLRVTPYEIKSENHNGTKFYGRWFRRFCGADADINNLDNEKIADKIIEHLFKNEYRFFIKENADLEKETSKYKKGRLDLIANTISSNHLRKNLDKKEVSKLSETDISVYFYKQKILSVENLYSFYQKDKPTLEKYRSQSEKYYDECAKVSNRKERKEKKPKKDTLEFSEQNVLNTFKECYEKLFGNEKITNLVQKNNKNHNGFIAHEAVRDFYIALLRSYRAKVEAFYKICKDKKGKVPEFNIDKNIPKDVSELLKKLKLKEENKDINADIRLGKIIHYTGINASKTDIEKSHYWTSTGQTEVKRSEAFIKSWFNFITFASHSLRYLSDSDKMQKAHKEYFDKNKHYPDVLSFPAEYKAEDNTVKVFLDTNDFSKKINLVLGEKHGFENNLINLYEFVRTKLNDLRNSTFHFKGIDEVAKKLEEKSDASAPIKDIIKAFYTKDEKAELKNLWATLVSVKIGEHLNEPQIIDYWQELTQETTDISIVTLPKFVSFLKCVDGFYNFTNTGITFIAPPKSGQQQSSDWQCAYKLMQNLYAKPFLNWFQNNQKLNGWINKAKQDLEKLQKIENDDVFKLTEFPECNDFSEYLYKLDGLASQNGSMQNGYASNKTTQKKKANSIERFKIYVLKHAFNEYLTEKNFKYLCNEKLTGQSGHNPTNLPKDTTETETKPWQQELYLLLHFVPVGIACDLEHQFKKYTVTFMRLSEFKAEKDFSIEEQKKHINESKIDEKMSRNNKDIKEILQVFELYRNNNDAKFTGNENDELSPKIDKFYMQDSAYKRIYNLDNIDANQKQKQRRELREFVRFGISNYLLGIAENNQVTKDKVDKYLKDSENIASWQSEKTKLHNEWKIFKEEQDNLKSNNDKYKPKPFAKKIDYTKNLKLITDYNQLNSHVRLVDYRKIHKLTMQVLGRLIGYSFMYERDLYFITLAYFNKQAMDSSKQKEFFGNCKKRLEKLKEGRAVTAFFHIDCPHPQQESKCKSSCKPKNIPNYIQKILAMGINKQKPENHIRNEFAHFDMLSHSKLNITTYINQARDLMSYDRKLKNAVAKSIKTIFEKEGLDIIFTCNDSHKLEKPFYSDKKEDKDKNQIKAKLIPHLGTKDITQETHSEDYIKMVNAILEAKPE